MIYFISYKHICVHPRMHVCTLGGEMGKLLGEKVGWAMDGRSGGDSGNEQQQQ